MSAIMKAPGGDLTLQDPKRLKLIRDTVAKQCNDSEFNWFIDICKHTRLDPLRRQIYCFVFHAKDPEKRQMVPVVAIGGFRAIAQRTGCYRADNRPARYEVDRRLISSTNPIGLIKAEVSVYVHSHGEWFETVGEAYWDEFAPIVDEWADDERTGKRKKTGKKSLDSKKDGWTRMPRLMLAKCAEAIALRKAWPDDLGQIYEESEMDRHQVIDLTPSESVEKAETERKLELIGGKDAVMVDWGAERALERLPAKEFWDASLRWMATSDADTIRHWIKRNAMVRGEMKAKYGADYLSWWRLVEGVINRKDEQEASDRAALNAALNVVVEEVADGQS